MITHNAFGFSTITPNNWLKQNRSRITTILDEQALLDFKKNIWFSRNLREMSKYLNSEPTLVILEQSDPPLKTPLPQPIGLNIPNNHLSYAITWFSLAFVWFGMTIYMLWRIKN